MAHVAKSPGSGEDGSYQRIQQVFCWKGPDPLINARSAHDFDWLWIPQGGQAGPFSQFARAFIGFPDGSWRQHGDLIESRKTTTGVYNGHYLFRVQLPNGLYCFSIEFATGWGEVIMQPFEINDTGAPLVGFKPWIATRRFEREYGKIMNAAIQVEPHDQVPVPPQYKFKSLPLLGSNGAVLPKSAYWVEIMFDNHAARLDAHFAKSKLGTVITAQLQKYYHSSAIGQGQFPASVLMMDGPIGVGTIGHPYKIIIRRGDKVAMWVETNGRFVIACLEDITTPPRPGSDMSKNLMPDKEGYIQTVVGWRVKPGTLRHHDGLHAVGHMYPTEIDENRAAFNADHEMMGNWAQVVGPHFLLEPWGWILMRLMSDGSIDRRDGLEFITWDTLNHRGLYGNMGPAHPAFYKMPDFAPEGYVPPAEPTGQVDLFHYTGSTNGQPTELCNEPWDGDISPITGRVYYWNRLGNSIVSLTPKGKDVRLEFKSGVNPTDAELGIPLLNPSKPHLGHVRLGRGKAVKDLRPFYRADGPTGVGALVQPMGGMFTSTGKLRIASGYLFDIIEFDTVTREVRLFGSIPENAIARGSDSAASREICLIVDNEGIWGPLNATYAKIWWGAMGNLVWWLDDGTYMGSRTWTSGVSAPNGPLDKCFEPGYGWGFGIGEYKALSAGSAGGSQCQLIRLKRPTDPVFDYNKWSTGDAALRNDDFYLAHGPHGQANLGYPRYEELASWDDARLSDYLRAWGIPASLLAAAMYTIRWAGVDIDYSFVALPTIENMGVTMEGEYAVVTADVANATEVKVQAIGPGGVAEKSLPVPE